MKRLPTPPPQLWGLWKDDGGPDDAGCWIEHTNGPRSGPMVFTTEEDARVAADREAREIGQQIGIQGVIRPLLIGVAPDPRPVDHAPDPRPADDEDDNPTRCPTCGLPFDPGWSEGPGDCGPRPERSG